MNCQPLLPSREPPDVRPPLVFSAVRRRAGRDRACVSAGRIGPCRRAARPIRSPPRSRTSPPKAKRVIYLFMAGRAQPSGAVRQQAATGQVRRHLAPARTAQGLPRGVHQSELQAARAEIQVRQARPERRGAVGDSARTWRRWPTTSPSSSRWSPTPSITRPARSS